jgi:hypothetical protein
MAIEPNAAEPAPDSERSMMVYPGAVEFVPWDTGGAVHFDRRRYAPDGLRYVRYDARGGDPRLYDFGKLIIATSGLDAAYEDKVIGKLFVQYDVTLSSPQFDTKVEYPTSTMLVLGEAKRIPIQDLSYTHIPFLVYQLDDSQRNINPLRYSTSFISTEPIGARDFFQLPTGNYKITWQLTFFHDVTVRGPKIDGGSVHTHFIERKANGATAIIPGTTNTNNMENDTFSSSTMTALMHCKAENYYAVSCKATAGVTGIATWDVHGHTMATLIIELVL